MSDLTHIAYRLSPDRKHPEGLNGLIGAWGFLGSLAVDAVHGKSAEAGALSTAYPARGISRSLGYYGTFTGSVPAGVVKTNSHVNRRADQPFTVIASAFNSDTGGNGSNKVIFGDWYNNSGSQYAGFYFGHYNNGGTYRTPIFQMDGGGPNVYIGRIGGASAAVDTSNKTTVSAVTYNGSLSVNGVRLFVNGIEPASYTDFTNGSISATARSNHSPLIGARPNTGGTWDLGYVGKIGKVLFFNRVLAQSEIREISLAILAYPLGLTVSDVIGSVGGGGATAKPWLYRRTSSVSRPYLQVA